MQTRWGREKRRGIGRVNMRERGNESHIIKRWRQSERNAQIEGGVNIMRCKTIRIPSRFLGFFPSLLAC